MSAGRTSTSGPVLQSSSRHPEKLRSEFPREPGRRSTGRRPSPDACGCSAHTAHGGMLTSARATRALRPQSYYLLLATSPPGLCRRPAARALRSGARGLWPARRPDRHRVRGSSDCLQEPARARAGFGDANLRISEHVDGVSAHARTDTITSTITPANSNETKGNALRWEHPEIQINPGFLTRLELS